MSNPSWVQHPPKFDFNAVAFKPQDFRGYRVYGIGAEYSVDPKTKKVYPFYKYNIVRLAYDGGSPRTMEPLPTGIVDPSDPKLVTECVSEGRLLSTEEFFSHIRDWLRDNGEKLASVVAGAETELAELVDKELKKKEEE